MWIPGERSAATGDGKRTRLSRMFLCTCIFDRSVFIVSVWEV